MSTDRSLATLLRALQSAQTGEDGSRLLGSATTLLTLLSNPLNVTLLASQILTAPAVWERPDGLRTNLRILSVFNSASIHIIRQETSPPPVEPYLARNQLAKDEWVIAIVNGADEKSPRWKHLLLLGGILIGFEAQDRQGLSASLRRKLESAIVNAVNLALRDSDEGTELAGNSVVMVLNHVFHLLSIGEQAQIDVERLLPTLCWAQFFSKEGLHCGYFLSTMDADLIEGRNKKFNWSPKSSSYVQIQCIASSPLVTSLGSMSRLTAFSVERVQNIDLLAIMIEDMGRYTRSLCVQWRQNKLSEIDVTEESVFLSDETLQTLLPMLWQILKSSMFATIVILRSLLGRVIEDRRVPVSEAPFIAIQTLHMLRNLYFISSRLGRDGFSQYTFVYLTAIDILSKYPVQAEAFLREIRPAELGRIPQHPLDRCHDLFFLNTAEHFTLVLTPNMNEELLIGAATPYLGIGGDQRLREIFEAAHTVMLAVLAAPQCADMTVKYMPFYVDALFKVFPQNISSQQFRMATKTLVRITTPPSPISANQPLLSSTLLELVRSRAQSASKEPLPQLTNAPSSSNEESHLSEQAVLVLTLIDSLPFLPVHILEEWLPLTAETLNLIQDQNMLPMCRQRFWEILSSGDMDVERAEVCVTWWCTRGGREMVLYSKGKEIQELVMSGGLGEASKL